MSRGAKYREKREKRTENRNKKQTKNRGKVEKKKQRELKEIFTIGKNKRGCLFENQRS